MIRGQWSLLTPKQGRGLGSRSVLGSQSLCGQEGQGCPDSSHDLFCRQEERKREALPLRPPLRPPRMQLSCWKDPVDVGAHLRVSLVPAVLLCASICVSLHWVGGIPPKPRLARGSHVGVPCIFPIPVSLFEICIFSILCKSAGKCLWRHFCAQSKVLSDAFCDPVSRRGIFQKFCKYSEIILRKDGCHLHSARCMLPASFFFF